MQAGLQGKTTDRTRTDYAQGAHGTGTFLVRFWYVFGTLSACLDQQVKEWEKKGDGQDEADLEEQPFERHCEFRHDALASIR